MSNLDEKRRQKGRRRRPAGAARRAVKRRVRPAARAAKRKANAAKRPMPKPPARRPLRPAARPAARPTAKAAASPELQAQLEAAQSRFAGLESKAQLGDVYRAIGEFDAQLIELPLALEALRRRGYVHSEQLEDRLEALEESWDDTRPRVESTLQRHVERLDKDLDKAERQVQRLRPAASVLRTAETLLGGLEKRISGAETAVTNLYSGLESDLHTAQWDINRASVMMDALDESANIVLRETEGPLLAVKTEWRRDGDEGPEGMLFLTDQRLLFEQREEVVTKKRFGIFKAESEMVQELLLEGEVAHIESVGHKEEGGFLGMGKDDILDIVFTADGPLSRARFHLKGQDSADWAALIKRVQTGEIDDDRAQEYMDELEEAQATAVSFPTQCPNCFAAVPTPPRGVTSAACEFCGATIVPES
ncbi:MAG: hypothetical protein GY803_06925 [Chloroflexi bacterium]|nr:hypothetical protein [Chloroflexota bacterium]